MGPIVKDESKRGVGELIRVNWLLLFWPEADLGGMRLLWRRKRGKAWRGKLWRGRKERFSVTNLRGERDWCGEATGRLRCVSGRERPIERKGRKPTGSQHVVQCMFHTCWTAARFAHNYKHESKRIVWVSGGWEPEREREAKGRQKKVLLYCAEAPETYEEGESVKVREQIWDNEKWTDMKFLNVENHLSAPIYPVWNQRKDD